MSILAYRSWSRSKTYANTLTSKVTIRLPNKLDSVKQKGMCKIAGDCETMSYINNRMTCHSILTDEWLDLPLLAEGHIE